MENGHDFLLWCRLCGNSVPCTMDDLDALRRDGYPSCCDEMMTMYTSAYFLRGERPNSSEPAPATTPVN
jgi:hypothetical protein